jgi:hypothetical protein
VLDAVPAAAPARLGSFEPKALRVAPSKRRLVEEFTERVLAAHPVWPWLLIGEEARRRIEEVFAAMRQ